MGGLPTSTVNGFAADPDNPQTMYVGMRDGVFVSRDAGATWTRPGGPHGVAAVAVHPERPAEVLAVTTDGVLWRSGDRGSRWERR